jgi:hypothetical protein
MEKKNQPVRESSVGDPSLVLATTYKRRIGGPIIHASQERFVLTYIFRVRFVLISWRRIISFEKIISKGRMKIKRVELQI